MVEREGMSRGRERYPNILRASVPHDVRGRNDLGGWCVCVCWTPSRTLPDVVYRKVRHRHT